MGTTVARLKNGDLLLAGKIDERMPAVTNGLVAHFPLDGRGGTVDRVAGFQTDQNLAKGINLLDVFTDWRNPLSWSTRTRMTYDEAMDALRMEGYHATWLLAPVIVDPEKTYEISVDIFVESRPNNEMTYIGGHSTNKDKIKATRNYDYTMASGNRPPIGEWFTYRLTRTGTAAAGSGTSQTFDTVKGWTGDQLEATLSDRLIKYYHFGGLINYSNSGGVTYLRNPRVEVVNPDTSNVEDSGGAIRVEAANRAFTLPNEIIDLEEGSISVRFRPSAGFFQGSYNRVVGHATGANPNEIQIMRNGTGKGLVFTIANAAGVPSNGWTACASADLVEGEWYDVVARWSKSQNKMSLSINGETNELNNVPNWPTIKGTLAVGYHPNVAERTSKSEFQDLSFYNRYLTDEEVKRLHGKVLSFSSSGDGLIKRLTESAAELQVGATPMRLRKESARLRGVVKENVSLI